MNDIIKQQATLLQGATGYRVLIPDLYKGKIGVDKEEAHHVRQLLQQWLGLGCGCGSVALALALAAVVAAAVAVVLLLWLPPSTLQVAPTSFSPATAQCTH